MGPARRPPAAAASRGAVGARPVRARRAGDRNVPTHPSPRSRPRGRWPPGASATRRPTLDAADLRTDERSNAAPRLVVLCVDLSGSMGASRRAAAATGAAIGLLDDAYQRRHRVALVGFGGDDARLVLAPTSSVEIARNRLGGLTTGGATPLAAGIRAALDVISRDGARRAARCSSLLTDGRATGPADAMEQALDAAATVRNREISALVFDCEDGPVRLGLARSLAAAMSARLVPLAEHGDDAATLIAGRPVNRTTPTVSRLVAVAATVVLIAACGDEGGSGADSTDAPAATTRDRHRASPRGAHRVAVAVADRDALRHRRRRSGGRRRHVLQLPRPARR